MTEDIQNPHMYFTIPLEFMNLIQKENNTEITSPIFKSIIYDSTLNLPIYKNLSINKDNQITNHNLENINNYSMLDNAAKQMYSSIMEDVMENVKDKKSKFPFPKLEVLPRNSANPIHLKNVFIKETSLDYCGTIILIGEMRFENINFINVEFLIYRDLKDVEESIDLILEDCYVYMCHMEGVKIFITEEMSNDLSVYIESNYGKNQSKKFINKILHDME